MYNFVRRQREGFYIRFFLLFIFVLFIISDNLKRNNKAEKKRNNKIWLVETEFQNIVQGEGRIAIKC